MKKTLFTLALFCSASLLSGQTAANAFVDGEDAVSYRQATFQTIRFNLVDINDMFRGNVPYDLERVQRRAEALATLSQLPWEAFNIPGADHASGKVKAELWQNLEDFNSRGDKFAADAAALHEAAQAGDRRQIQGAFREFANNCKACHDNYRAD
ncbi:MAG: cytochrome c [Alkalimonas sp.]|nr:cytochrome c [Alkalimonas sp.]